MSIQALAGLLFPGLKERLAEFNEIKNAFEKEQDKPAAVDKEVKRMRRKSVELSKGYCELKLEDLQEAEAAIKVSQVALKALFEQKEITSKSCCGCSKEKLLKRVVYVVAAFGPLLSFFNDTSIGGSSESSQGEILKYIRQYSTLIALPLIHGIEQCKKQEADLKSNIRTLTVGIEASLSEIVTNKADVNYEKGLALENEQLDGLEQPNVESTTQTEESNRAKHGANEGKAKVRVAQVAGAQVEHGARVKFMTLGTRALEAKKEQEEKPVEHNALESTLERDVVSGQVGNEENPASATSADAQNGVTVVVEN